MGEDKSTKRNQLSKHQRYYQRNKERRRAQALRRYHEQQAALDTAFDTQTQMQSDSENESVEGRFDVLRYDVDRWKRQWGGMEEWHALAQKARLEADSVLLGEISQHIDWADDLVVGIQGLWYNAALPAAEDVASMWNIAFATMRMVLGGKALLIEDPSDL